MTTTERLGLAILRRLDPERAHGLALRSMSSGLVPLPGAVTSSRLATKVAGLDLPNPVGLAAGFDKNAQAVDALSRTGFGMIEVGAATPRPQAGNPRPRLFRLPDERAVINRFGFNNDGAAAIAARLQTARPLVPVGLNLGANKDSNDRAADFARVLTVAGPWVDFVTINVSSPNTEKLRDLQGTEALAAIIASVQEANDALQKRCAIFVKIAPDLSEDEIAGIGNLAMKAGVDGLIATNTTLSREGLTSAARVERGGLSGPPLFERSTRVLARLSSITGGGLPLIGVGGIASAQDAYAKIRAGASAVQLYTALTWGGLSLVNEIVRGLESLLERDGFLTIADAVATDRDRWL